MDWIVFLHFTETNIESGLPFETPPPAAQYFLLTSSDTIYSRHYFSYPLFFMLRCYVKSSPQICLTSLHFSPLMISDPPSFSPRNIPILILLTHSNTIKSKFSNSIPLCFFFLFSSFPLSTLPTRTPIPHQKLFFSLSSFPTKSHFFSPSRLSMNILLYYPHSYSGFNFLLRKGKEDQIKGRGKVGLVIKLPDWPTHTHTLRQLYMNLQTSPI